MKIEKPFLATILFIIVLVLFFLGGFFFGSRIHSPEQSQPDTGVACTMEAKLCPDGSSVGRQGPNCEFAECPSETPAKSE